MEAKYIFGIDLGTTYSVISYLDENLLIQTCSNENGGMITPSVVDLSDENVTVGQVAKDNKLFYPHSVLDFFKCEMGQGHALKYYGENFDKTTTAIDLSSEVLKYLAKYAEDATGSKVSVVVVTVPAYFGSEEKQATKEAAEKAGFEKVHLIEEPTAAAVYYGYKGDKNETVLVYDLGGGTFDVVAVEINGYDYNCFVVDGDQQLGGKQWDMCMQEIFIEKLAEQGIERGDLSDEDIACIQSDAEKAKKTLTVQPEADVKLRLDAGRAQFKVTRQEFEDATKSLLDRTIETTRSVKTKAEEKGKTITKILLVGGSSYMPQVQQRLIAEFPDLEVPNPMDPNMAVSKGAAFYGKALLQIIMERLKQQETETETSTSTENPTGDDGFNFELTPDEKKIGDLYKENKMEIMPGEVINIKKVSVSSIGICGESNGKRVIMTILKRGDELPVTKDMDIPISASAIAVGNVELPLYEHRSEAMYVDPEDLSIEPKEMEKKSGEISNGLPVGSTMHVHMTIDEEGLLKLKATDPNGLAIELEAKADAKSAD